jgi:hypothetical protein
LGGFKETSLAVSSKSGGGNYNNFDSTDFSDDSNNEPEARVHHLLQQLGPYGFFQYESGVHRIQRVPVNDNKLQTSAVSVAVLPSIPDNQITDTLPPNELKMETMRTSGVVGQHVNTTESVVHVMQEEQSQHKTKTQGAQIGGGSSSSTLQRAGVERWKHHAFFVDGQRGSERMDTNIQFPAGSNYQS